MNLLERIFFIFSLTQKLIIFISFFTCLSIFYSSGSLIHFYSPRLRPTQKHPAEREEKTEKTLGTNGAMPSSLKLVPGFSRALS